MLKLLGLNCNRLMTKSYSYTIEKNHPSLPGHFPGHPIVPGVIILQRVVTALESEIKQSQCKIIGFPSVKFLNPVLPGVQFDIVFDSPNNTGTESTINFSCMVNSQKMVTGRVEYK